MHGVPVALTSSALRGVPAQMVPSVLLLGEPEGDVLLPSQRPSGTGFRKLAICHGAVVRSYALAHVGVAGGVSAAPAAQPAPCLNDFCSWLSLHVWAVQVLPCRCGGVAHLCKARAPSLPVVSHPL